MLQGECSCWKFERGEDVDDTKKTTNNNKKQQQQKKGSKKQQEVEIVNVDDDSSSTVAVQQLNNNNNDNNNSNDENKVRIVQCGCPTIDSWAIEEWEKYQQQILSKKKKNKGGKKRKRKNSSVDVEDVTDLSCGDNNVVVTVDEDDTENSNATSLAAITPTLICGQRQLGGDECCPCDFNPVSSVIVFLML